MPQNGLHELAAPSASLGADPEQIQAAGAGAELSYLTDAAEGALLDWDAENTGNGLPGSATVSPPAHSAPERDRGSPEI